MTTTNTEGPRHLSSSSPKVELGPAKAIVSAVAGGVVAAGVEIINAIADGAVDLNEGWQILTAALVGAGIIGSATYLKSTSVTLK